MRFYKETNFKDTEIGRIPKEWEVVKVDKLFDLYKGTTPSTKVEEYWNGTIPFVTPTDITKINDVSEMYLKTTENYITEEGLKSKGLKLIPEDSLLLTSRATIGYLAINKVKVAINQGVISLKPRNQDTNVIFFYYLLQNFRDFFESLAGGSTYKEISMSTFSDVKVLHPSLSEQKKIAEIISTIDKAIQKANEIIAKTERLKKGLMEELLTKGIGHKEFKDTEIGRIPKEWEVVRLGDKNVSILVKSGSTPLKGQKEYWNGNIPFVTQSDMTKVDRYLYETYEKITEIGLKSSNLILIPKNSILLSMYGTIGKVVINKNPVAVSQNIAAIILNKKYVDHEYLFYAIQKYSSQFKKQAKIITLKHLDIQIVKNMLLPFPSPKEQQKIAEILSTVDKKLEIERKQKEKLERIKRGMMDLLLTGKIRVKVD